MTQVYKPKYRNDYVLLRKNGSVKHLDIGISTWGGTIGEFNVILIGKYTINDLKQIIKAIEHAETRRKI